MAYQGEKLVHTAMDGKVMRGTLGHAKEGQPPVHLLSLYECESGIVIAQEAVKSKENEITAATALLHLCWLLRSSVRKKRVWKGLKRE